MFPKTCTNRIRQRSDRHTSKFRCNLVPALLLGCVLQCALATSASMAKLQGEIAMSFDAQIRDPEIVTTGDEIRNHTQVPMISSNYVDDLADWANVQRNFATGCENLVFIDGDQFMQPAFCRSTTGHDLIEKCSNTFFVLLTSVKCTDYATKHLTDNPEGHTDFPGYLQTHPRVWASLYIPNESETVDNRLRALALWMCHRLPVKRCILISNDNAISCGRQLEMKNYNWGGRVLWESLLESLPDSVIPLKQDDYLMRVSGVSSKKVLNVDKLVNDMTSKTLDECLASMPKIKLRVAKPQLITQEEIEARRKQVLAAKAAKSPVNSPQCTGMFTPGSEDSSPAASPATSKSSTASISKPSTSGSMTTPSLSTPAS